MLVDVVQTTTRDDVRLDGMLQTPPTSGPTAIAVDAFCLIHGTGGNFYSSSLFDGLSERFIGFLKAGWSLDPSHVTGPRTAQLAAPR